MDTNCWWATDLVSKSTKDVWCQCACAISIPQPKIGQNMGRTNDWPPLRKWLKLITCKIQQVAEVYIYIYVLFLWLYLKRICLITIDPLGILGHLKSTMTPWPHPQLLGSELPMKIQLPWVKPGLDSWNCWWVGSEIWTSRLNLPVWGW